MRIAYLIPAHMDPKQLCRLVDALDVENNAFYIHIDKKRDQSCFEAAVGSRENVHFIKKRILMK